MKIAILLGLLLPLSGHAALSVDSVLQNYASVARADYDASVDAAKNLQTAIQVLVSNPSDQTLAQAKIAWRLARSAYSPTEVYRFYEGPIDNANGPEGLINAWPLDEAYIDYVAGNKEAGIINNIAAYPNITKELLISLNEKDGEKNISVGFHAIEFLLWGQDFNPNGPGNRPVKDYIVGVGKNAERRAAYLSVLGDLLVEHLALVANGWEPNAYAAEFTKAGKEGLRRIFVGAFRLTGEELSHERMYVAYDTQQQEDEHSCFSDTTHLDFRENFVGMASVLMSGPYELVKEGNPTQAETLKAAVRLAGKRVVAIPGPFDRAIYSPEGRTAILEAVTALEDLAGVIKQSAEGLGVTLE